jgi:hypothetical protein
LTIENGAEFKIDYQDALGMGVVVQPVAASGPLVKLNITGNLIRTAGQSLPVIRFRSKKNPTVSHTVHLLVLPPKIISVSFFNVEDKPPKPGQPSRRTTQSEDTVTQMITEANRILTPQANIEIQNAGLGVAKVNEQLPMKLYFTQAVTDREHKSAAWREKFVEDNLKETPAQRFSVFFFTDF